MALSAVKQRRLVRLAERQRKAQAAVDAARAELHAAIVDSHDEATVREIAELVDLTHQRVWQIVAKV